MDGTVFDLRKPVLLGPRLKEVPGPGFDHNFCLASPEDAWKERHAARLVPDWPRPAGPSQQPRSRCWTWLELLVTPGSRCFQHLRICLQPRPELG